MKQLHILNVGYPKSGTTWVWENMTHLDGFGYPYEKEHPALRQGQNIVDYVKSYSDYDITANFDTTTFQADRYIIHQLSLVPQVRASIIFRNPYEIYWSLYNYLKVPDLSYSEFADVLVREGWFANMSKIVARWQQFFTDDRFHLFFYEDLVADRLGFFRVYCKTMGLPEPRTLTYMGVNVTKYQYIDQILYPRTVEMTNQYIQDLQTVAGRDLTHWLR